LISFGTPTTKAGMSALLSLRRAVGCVRGEPRRPRSHVTDDSTQAVPHFLQLTLSIE